MSGRKSSTPRRNQIVKRLLDEVLPKKSVQSKGKTAAVAAAAAATAAVTAKQLVHKGTQVQLPNQAATCASSATTVREEVKQGQGMLTAPAFVSQQLSSHLQPSGEDYKPVSANSQFSYSPMYRRYFGLTPPNPRLCNPRLLEDYIDWYINVYMEEELPWQWINVDNPAARTQQGEEEAQGEAKKLASTSPSSLSLTTPINKK